MKTVLGLLLIVSLRLAGQTAGPVVPAIEVATIKPTTWTDQAVFERLRVTQKGCPRLGPQIRGNQLSWTNATVCALVRSAYDFEPYQLEGGPKWFRSSTDDPTMYFDLRILVQLPQGAVITREQAKSVLRVLLADWFGLRTHEATKELPVFELKTDKGGPKLLSTKLATCDNNRPGRFLQSCDPTFTMARFANSLSNYVDRPVLDRTGITQEFAFLLTWSEPNAEQGLNSPPELLTALRDQLGLKLESAKDNVPVLVIDNVEKPSEN